MSPDGFSLSASSMIALASETLSLNGYRVVRDMTDMKKLGDRALLAEDAYSVISVVAFETWQQLENDWAEAQADLVDLLARRLSRSAPKAWDGYLVLLCAGEPSDRLDTDRIERDTSRVRKIVATGGKLRTSADINRVLDLLLPLELPDNLSALEDVLDALPELMKNSVDRAKLKIVVDAFRDGEPPLERLHESGGGR
ncbi:hypothetical protein [Mesorhizobium sp. B2-3-4]|uniref:hypothetical protein n=1 Tax=Mesorhizobium sp. B2-3-4 TaxID=2589959 RepID=UPI001126D692|nr:hypothetical protein [Mesorhizobium sp. B2-3-4]TPM30029.1 hypothetical protein FJ967_27555 [Mesorhizobium sp. B2-3-4]